MTRKLLGALDHITPDGVVEGWCWDAESPEEQLRVTISVDGKSIGAAIAGLFRDDLKSAGIGNGAHHFRFILPIELLEDKRALEVRMQEAESGEYVGNAYYLQQPEAANLDDRIVELEAEVRLLSSRLSEVSRAQGGGPAATDLFQVIGSFFMELAGNPDAIAGTAAGERLSEAISDVSNRYEALALPQFSAPAATVIVDGCAPLSAVHPCLKALSATLATIGAEVHLLDRGEYADLALTPVSVRNLNYVRIGDGLLSERNRIAERVQSDYLAFISGWTLPMQGWLAELISALQNNPQFAVAGSLVLRSDGVVHHAGLQRLEAGGWADLGAGRLAGDPDCNAMAAVSGFGDLAVVVRRADFQAVGGFNPAIPRLEAAMLDLSLRLAATGRYSLYQPQSVVRLQDGAAGDARVNIVEAVG